MVPKIHIVSGEINSGKTTTAKKLISSFRNEGACVRGFICEGIQGEQGKDIFFIVDIGTGKRMVFAINTITHSEEELYGKGFHDAPSSRSPISTGRYRFSSDAINFGESLLKNSVDADVLVLDELGILELQENGFFKVTRWLLTNYAGTMLLVIREKLLSQLLSKLNINKDEVIFHYPDDTRDDYG